MIYVSMNFYDYLLEYLLCLDFPVEVKPNAETNAPRVASIPFTSIHQGTRDQGYYVLRK